MVDLGWTKEAEQLYLSLQAKERWRRYLEAIDELLDLIEDNPAGIRARRFSLTALGGVHYWLITKHVGTDDVAVLWHLLEGVPTIAFVGLDNFKPIVPLSSPGD
jgi:hypothetical protein